MHGVKNFMSEQLTALQGKRTVLSVRWVGLKIHGHEAFIVTLRFRNINSIRTLSATTYENIPAEGLDR